LHILHAIETSQAGVPEARVVKLASWTNPEHTALAPHEPEITKTVVALDRAA
jgi:hypothetical protein